MMSVRFMGAALCATLLISCQGNKYYSNPTLLTEPPKEQGTFRQADLVEVVGLEPGIRLDIRYATTNNFMGRPVYRQGRAFLQRPAAEALARANRSLKAMGYGILIFDGYRPWSVTKAFWNAATPAQRKIGFVADPAKGSKHNRGCAVDVTLYELASGREVEMPTPYDEFSERAFSDYPHVSPQAAKNRAALRAAMEAEGFAVLKEEWWHFDYKDWPHYRILDVSFEDVLRKSEKSRLH